MVTEDTKETTYFCTSAGPWLSRRGMRSPSEILYSLSNTPLQMLTLLNLQYMMPAAFCW